MNRGRTTAALVSFALLAGACASGEEFVDEAEDIASDIADEVQDGTDGDGQGGAGQGDGDVTGGDATGGDATGGDTTDGPTRVEANDLAGVGANGKPMLQGSYPTLVLEIDVQSCTSVDEAAVDHLVAALRGVVDKPGGIVRRGGNTFESDRRQWTSGDLRASAEQNRATASGGDEVSVYLQYVCGAFHSGGEETSALGVAYNASEVGLFPQRWNDGIGLLLGSNRSVERAVLVHEIGHLFGLVNLTYTSELDHEDPEHPGHSSSQESVMYWAIETTAIGQVFSGPPPDTFDNADRADLEGLKAGRY